MTSEYNWHSLHPVSSVGAQSPTELALLTPGGRGAVAVIAVRGEQAVEAVQTFFRPAGRNELDALPPRRPAYGHWRSPDGEATEDVVVSKLEPRYVEIHCHGGQIAWRRIASDLQKRDVLLVNWEQMLARDAADPLCQAAHSALPYARTAKAAGVLLDQMNGALSRELNALLNELQQRTKSEGSTKSTHGSLEPDDQHGSDLSTTGSHAKWERRLAEVIKWSRFGQRLTQPWRVALVGAPNVGKSSLINALLGFERSIVFDLPGTTRDIISDRTAFDGWPVELMDTVGLRETAAAIESSGIERTQSIVANADLIVEMHSPDTSSDLPWRHADIEAFCPVIRILNKCDLMTEDSISQDQLFGNESALCISATHGIGLSELREAIRNRLIPEEPPVGQAMPITTDQADALERAAQALFSKDTTAALRELNRLLVPT